MHARRPPLGQRRQAQAALQIERGEGGEVAEPEGERASVAQREGEKAGGGGNRHDGDGDADDWCMCTAIYVPSYMSYIIYVPCTIYMIGPPPPPPYSMCSDLTRYPPRRSGMHVCSMYVSTIMLLLLALMVTIGISRAISIAISIAIAYTPTYLSRWGRGACEGGREGVMQCVSCRSTGVCIHDHAAAAGGGGGD